MLNKKIAVVTSLIGAYDVGLLEFEYDSNVYEFICYTNIKRLRSNTWNIVYIEDLQVKNDNAKSSYYYKWNPHKYLDHDKYDTMIWVDSSFVSISMKHIDAFVDKFNKLDTALYIEKHPSRNSLVDELNANISLNKDDITTMKNTVNGYFKDGYLDSYTVMVETGFSIRKFKDASLIKFSDKIWEELSNPKNTKRDQLVYDYCMWKTKFKDYQLFTFNEKCEAIRFVDHPHRAKHKDKVLLVGPWMGEDVYEPSWITFIDKYLSTHPIDKVMIGCRPGHEKLYSHMSPDKFIISDVDGVRSGALINGAIPTFNITNTNTDIDIVRLTCDMCDSINTNKKIHVLWATVRPATFDEKYQMWLSKASIKDNIIPHVLVDSEDDKKKIHTIPSENIIVSTPPRKGVCYPSYVLSSNLVANVDDIVIFASDDFEPMDNWDIAMYSEFTLYNGSLLVDDKCLPIIKDIMTIPIMTYDTLCKLNKIIYHPAYAHCYSDNELLYNLYELGLVKDIRLTKSNIYFTHNHYVNGKRQKDLSDINNDYTTLIGKSLWNVRRKMTLSERLAYDINEPLLSILILTIPSRKEMLNRLLMILSPQLNVNVEMIIEEDNEVLSIGEKRNNALNKAKGRYVCFIDDDDRVPYDYVQRILSVINEKDVDCCSLSGVVTLNSRNPKAFKHSIKYSKWEEIKDGLSSTYVRPPNHLNVIRRDIAKFVGFENISFGEDKDFSMRILPYLSVEGEILGDMYFYDSRTNK